MLLSKKPWQIEGCWKSLKENVLKKLIEEHANLTDSPKAKTILADWFNWKSLFKLVVPPSEKTKLGLVNILEKSLSKT